jgi:hypothetical protein
LSRYELDGFLKQHGVWLEEFERELALGDRLVRQQGERSSK